MISISSNSKAPIFYGWIVVACAFASLFICFGIAYSFSAFFKVFETEFEAGRSGVALVFSLASCLFFTIGAVTGPLSDRIGTKWVVMIGMVLIGGGLLAATQATFLWQLYLAYGLSVGLGVGFIYVPAIGAVQRWFIRKRGFASGIAVSGIGVGTLVVPLVASALIQTTDWRTSYVILGSVALVFGVLSSWFFVNSPQEKNLFPDGEKISPSVENKNVTIGGATVKEALHSRPFWMLYIAGILASLGIFLPFVHLTPYALDYGHSEGFAVFLVSLVGVGSVAGRFAMGGIADKLGRKISLTTAFFGMGVLLFMWNVSQGALALGSFAVLYGVFYGGFVALIPALTVDYFGGKNAGGIIGALYTNAAIGSLIGPPMAGLAFDLTQSYGLPIMISGVASVIAAILLFMMPEPKVWSPPSWH
ncbi:MAG: MFS transporter [Rhodospirillales bacterium]|nr:MFS transporter [Rhodospirillales bacterium]